MFWGSVMALKRPVGRGQALNRCDHLEILLKFFLLHCILYLYSRSLRLSICEGNERDGKDSGTDKFTLNEIYINFKKVLTYKHAKGLVMLIRGN